MTLQESSAAAAASAGSDAASSALERRLADLALRDIIPSLTNRKVDESKLVDLIESIKTSGVHTPILVRPLPAARLGETSSRKGERPSFEIVAGERRFRASQLAGMKTIPAVIRPIADGEAIEMQLIENVQREGLHPMEEAEGYERLMKFGESETGHKPTAEEIGKKVGRSKSYVYAKLKLLDLCHKGRDAFFAGKLDESKALLIARIPTEKRQLEALKEITTPDWQGDVMSYREAAQYVQQSHMLKLGSAKFKITDAQLIPAAGDCRSCPKRAGSNKELYADVDGADVCTDPDCFSSKTEAHAAAIRSEAEASGRAVIEGQEAKKLRPDAWGSIEGYLRLDDSRDSPTDKSLRKLLGADAPEPIVFIDPHDQSVSEVIPRDVATKLLKEKGVIEKNSYMPGSPAAAETSAADDRRKIEEKFNLGWRTGTAEAIYHAARVSHKSAKAIGLEPLRTIATDLLVAIKADQLRLIAKVLDPENSKVGVADSIRDFIREATEDKLVPAMFLIMSARDCEYWPGGRNEAPRLKVLAEDTGVDVDSVKQLVRDELRDVAAQKKERAAAKRAKEAPKDKPKGKGKGAAEKASKPAQRAAGAKYVRRPKNVIHSDQARAEIAAAMQEAEGGKKGGRDPADKSTGDLLAAAGDKLAFVINQNVRVLAEGLRGELEQWGGRKGIVRAIETTNEGLMIDVRFKGRNAGLVTLPAAQLVGA